MSGKRRDSEIENLLKEQWGVVTVAQLLSHGGTRSQIETMVARGQLHRLHRGVFAYGRRLLPEIGVLLAAQFACGSSSYLTRHTALALAKVRGQYLRHIDVGVPGRAVRVREAPIFAHAVHPAPLPHELRLRGPLRFASVARALLELAPDATEKELDRLITAAIRRGVLSHEDMLRLLEEHPSRRPGVKTLTAAYVAYLPPKRSRSEFERAFDAELAKRPWIPEPEHDVLVEAGGRVCEVDRLWRDYHLAVELDGGPYHSARDDVENDHEKMAKLLSIGISTFRVSDLRFGLEPELVLDDLEASLAGMGWRRAA